MAQQLSTVTNRKVWVNARTCYWHGTNVRRHARWCHEGDKQTSFEIGFPYPCRWRFGFRFRVRIRRNRWLGCTPRIFAASV
jgi:hypothetical protein